MHDIKALRDEPAAFDAALARRGLPAAADTILGFDQRRRQALTEAQEAQTRRNQLSKEIGQRKAHKQEADDLIAEVGRLKQAIETAEAEAAAAGQQQDELLAGLPNIVAPEVPDGPDESGNVRTRSWGEPRRLNGPAPDHVAVGEALGLMDFEVAARLAGARFVVLKADLARLERALAAFMLDLHRTRFGFTETSVPFLVREAALFGTGQLPKFRDDQFQTTDGRWLIPTAEVSLTNLVAGQILEADQLPLRLTAWTPCFRAEAGSAGRDTRGMIRQHQFSKVELVAIATPEAAEAEHERMVEAAEAVLRALELPFRTMLLCTGDTGFSARKTYDLEVWLPGQQTYREISSVSQCGPFQARRMGARYRPAPGAETRFVHTLNGSGVAVGRALVAVLETYRQEDGGVAVPAVLQPYLGGQTRIEAGKGL